MKKYITANTNNTYKRYMIEYHQHGQTLRVFARDEQEIKKLYNKYEESGGYGFRVFEIEYLGFLDDNGDIISE